MASLTTICYLKYVLGQSRFKKKCMQLLLKLIYYNIFCFFYKKKHSTIQFYFPTYIPSRAVFFIFRYLNKLRYFVHV